MGKDYSEKMVRFGVQ